MHVSRCGSTGLTKGICPVVEIGQDWSGSRSLTCSVGGSAYYWLVMHPLAPGELLVSRAGEVGGYFKESVVLILDRDDAGTLGVRLDLLSSYDLEDVLPGWQDLVSPPQRLFEGGPVSPNGAVCVAKLLHPGEEPPGWRRVFADIGLLHLDTPPELVFGAFSDLRIFAGYAGWDAGQVENELVNGIWHRMPARDEDIFGARPQGLWRRVLRRAGGNLSLYSTWSEYPEQN